MEKLFNKEQMDIATCNYDGEESEHYNGSLPTEMYQKFYKLTDRLEELIGEDRTWRWLGDHPLDILHFLNGENNNNRDYKLISDVSKLLEELKKDMIDYMYKYNPDLIKDKNKQN
jgi:hypothetical protein|tara:strand:- start:279 stop:623 length:345 start_codon:yes stop_codon:yes gene_type:complete